MTAGLDGLSKVTGEQAPPPNDNLDIMFSRIVKVVDDIDFIKKIYHVGIGNPITRDYGAFKLTSSDVHSLFNAWRLSQYVDSPKCIVEIGGGFGCLAAMLKRIWPYCCFIMVDLEESLALQKYYLKESFGDLKDFTFKSDMSGISHADLVINIRSMMEMTPEQVSYYLDHIQNKMKADWFYCVNRYYKYHALNKYKFDDHWAIYVSQQLMNQPHIHEYLLKREQNKMFTKQLSTLKSP